MLPEFGSESKRRDEFAHRHAALKASREFTGKETVCEGFSEVATEPAPLPSYTPFHLSALCQTIERPMP